MKRIYILATALCVCMASAGYAQDKPKADDKFKIEPTGRIYVDVAKYFKDTQPLSSGAAFGDIRFGMKASLNQWNGEIVFGYANSKVNFKDIFIQYTLKSKRAHWKLGHYVEPFGIEYIDGSVGNKFVTSSSASQAFGGKRHLGLQYTGWEKMIWYAAGIFADNNVASGANQGSQGYAATGRFVFNPLQQPGKILHIGAAGTYRRADSAGLTTEADGTTYKNPRSISYSANSGTVVESRKFITAKVTNAKYQARYGLEFIGAVGNVYVQGEYFAAHAKRRANLPSYDSKGFYSQIGVLAIGGAYKYDTKLARMLRQQAGQLEFILRYGWTNLNDSSADIMGGKQSDITFAANYAVTKFLHVRLNYTNVKLDENSVIGKERFDAVSARVMILF